MLNQVVVMKTWIWNNLIKQFKLNQVWKLNLFIVNTSMKSIEGFHKRYAPRTRSVPGAMLDFLEQHNML